VAEALVPILATTPAQRRSSPLALWHALDASGLLGGRVLKPILETVQAMRAGDPFAVSAIADLRRQWPGLQDLHAALEETLQEPPDGAATDRIIAAMLNTFPQGRPPDMRAYTLGLLSVAQRSKLGPQLLARACDRIGTRFLPSQEELRAACNAAREHAVIARNIIRWIVSNIAKAEARLPAARQSALEHQAEPETIPASAFADLRERLHR